MAETILPTKHAFLFHFLAPFGGATVTEILFVTMETNDKLTNIPTKNTFLHRRINLYFLDLQVLSMLFSHLQLIKQQTPRCAIDTKCQYSS